MPPLTPTPTSPGGPKQMPKWAWPVAIGGGLLIGFFLLRKPQEEYEEEQQEESPYPQQQGRGGGGGGALPFEEGALEAFGLIPSASEFQGSGTGDSGFGGGEGGGGGEASATSDGTQTAFTSQARDLFSNFSPHPVDIQRPAISSQPVYVPQTPISQHPVSIPGISGPTAPTGGGGSNVNKAQ